MSRLPRVAVGTIQPEADGAAMVCALLDSLERRGLRVQNFLSRACFSPFDAATVITGLYPRHLDTWLMSPEECRDVFLRGFGASDMAVIEGRFDQRVSSAQSGGSLDTLCQWLDVPRLAVVDVARLCPCQLPERPAGIDGLLLDNVSSAAELARLETLFESLWGVSVLGSLEEIPAVRHEMAGLAPGGKPSRELCRALGSALAARAQLDRICRIAAERDFPYRRASAPSSHLEPAALKIAIAYDDAFQCYFPDTLDLLEAKGAVLADFSPLRDERLPSGTDLVYIGCGHPERFAAELAENHCLASSLRDHVCSGRRVYAEGGGLAYLCQQLELSDGERLPMAGIFPAVARMVAAPSPPRPDDILTQSESWLGPAGVSLRGYVNSRWTIVPSSDLLRSYATAPGSQPALVGMHRAIGSRVHLNFAVQPAALARFFEPFSADRDDPLALANSL